MKSSKNTWNGKSRGGSFGYGFFILLINTLGIGVAYAFLSLVVVYFIPFAPKATKAIWLYNRRILHYGPLKAVAKLYHHYYIFGQTLIDKIAVAGGLSRKYSFVFENYEQMLALLDQGSVVIIGAHVGCWEIGSGFFGSYASKLNVVMFDGEYQKIKETLSALKVKHKIIPINNGSIESLLRMKQAIDNGEYLCFQGDRYMTGGNTCKVEFMGNEALFPQGPSLLAAKFSTPVIFYFAMREKGMRYRFIFKTLPAGMKQGEILKEYTSNLEEIINQYPQQWFNFYDLWQPE